MKRVCEATAEEILDREMQSDADRWFGHRSYPIRLRDDFPALI